MFNEEQAKMFQLVDETSLPSEVDQLPSTPCIVVCGSSPLTAGHFMIAVDQIIVKDGVTNCGVGGRCDGGGPGVHWGVQNIHGKVQH
ncbi:Interferon-induced 44 [Labeo rohita]|uniref:Interferon-induced 44 n=1 Tax=Labeo rohita TaxID=84645 RepID=A0A498P123_LABRO|nr:Interferon-induced 44 [Labeo rohita]